MQHHSAILLAYETKQRAQRELDQATAVAVRAQRAVTTASNHRYSVYTSTSSTAAERTFAQSMVELAQAFAQQANTEQETAQERFSAACAEYETLLSLNPC